MIKYIIKFKWNFIIIFNSFFIHPYSVKNIMDEKVLIIYGGNIVEKVKILIYGIIIFI